MEASTEVTDNVLVRRFAGDISQDDIIGSWKELFASDTDFSLYEGIIIDLSHARLVHDRAKFNELVRLLRENLELLEELKIAFVMDTPQVTQVILLDHMITQLQIRPFATLKGALGWIHI
jgi:hypothetical protein